MTTAETQGPSDEPHPNQQEISHPHADHDAPLDYAQLPYSGFMENVLHSDNVVIHNMGT